MVEELAVVDQEVQAVVVLVVRVLHQVVQVIHLHQVHHKDKQVVQEDNLQVIVVAAEVEAQVRQVVMELALIVVVQVVQEYQVQ